MLSPEFKRRNKLRSAWGEVGGKNSWLVSRLFDLTCDGSPEKYVDDKTWNDLEFPKIFSDIDSTITPIGSQYLFRRLRSYEFDSSRVAGRHEGYRVLQEDRDLREKLQLILLALEHDSAAHVADILFGALPGRPRHAWMVPLWGLVSLVALGAAALASSIWLAAAVLAVNGAVIFVTTPTLGRNAESLIDCRRMLGVADRIAAVRSEADLPGLRELIELRGTRRRLRVHLRWITRLSHTAIPLAYFSMAANLVCLAKLWAYTRAVDRFVQLRAEWTLIFESVASIDAAIAVGGFLHRTPRHCRPRVARDAVTAMTNLYHPLISNPVENSVTLDRRSALVTGSNMAGKTTFVKSVGINIILGHTLGICLASAATIPRSGVMASIRSEQSIESGKSRYLAEAQAILRMIDSATQGICRVFVIDELFSGTNTIERIAAAAAVLDDIGQKAQVLVTTHDVELQHLLIGKFDLFHFQENPEVSGFFDYRLHAGVTRERNAIRVLERIGFPSNIIEAALKTVGATMSG